MARCERRHQTNTFAWVSPRGAMSVSQADPAASIVIADCFPGMPVRRKREKDHAVYFGTFTCYQWIPLI